MPNYLQRISDIVTTYHNANPSVVWYHLCAGYQSNLPTHSPGLYPAEHKLLTQLQHIQATAITMPVKSFIATLNTQYEHYGFRFPSSLLAMLKAFLTLYPDYMNGLHAELLTTLDVQAYLIPDAASEMDNRLQRLEHDFNNEIHEVLLCKENFTARQVGKLIRIITQNLLADYGEKARRALLEMRHYLTNDELGVILQGLRKQLCDYNNGCPTEQYTLAACSIMINLHGYLKQDDINFIFVTLKLLMKNSLTNACLHATQVFIATFPDHTAEIIDFLIEIYQPDKYKSLTELLAILLRAYQKYTAKQDAIMFAILALYDYEKIFLA